MTDSNPSHFTSGLNDASKVSTRSTSFFGGATSRKRESGLLSALSAGTSRTGGPSPSNRAGRTSNRHDGGNIGQFLNESLYSSWSSMSGLATSLLGSSDLPGNSGARSSSQAPGNVRGRHNLPKPGSLRTARSWGPAPPTEQPGLGVIAGGTLADREAALKAARTASVLESHDGVNGGLDVTGKHKRRNSDDVKPSSTETEEVLVYVHWVQSSDTYQGLILRYKCREDAFRRANGLWSRDTIQTRKWLTIPVDACELRGRPCDPPAWHNEDRVDLLAPTPQIEDDGNGKQPAHDDFFSRPLHAGTTGADRAGEDEYPWTHVRWVKVDSIQQPIEIARVSRQAIGYFPPRRRKSIRTYSTLSTPRQSLDLSSNPPGSVEGPPSRRESSLGSRPQLSSTPVSTRSRMNSGGADTRPMWMRRPGGVGSLNKTVRAPGPDKDYFNTFTKKHIPGLNIDGPSMSVMGSETAHFGFGQDSTALVQSPFDEGRDTTSASQQGTGLDKAAAAVETWLRGALSKRPSTPMMSGRIRYGGMNMATEDSDLIELTDTASDDGKLLGQPALGLLDQPVGTTGRSGGEGSVVRVRGPTSGNVKGSKDD